VYNLKAAGQTTNEGIGASTRLTFLPIESERSNLHLGLVYGEDDFNQGAPFGGPGAATIAGRNSGTQVTSPTIAVLGSTGFGKVQTTYSAEAAGAFGPFFFQSEYANSTLEQSGSAPDQDVTSYYVQSSFFLTGETKPYKKDRGTFGTPKPIGENGAWELTARYDLIEAPDFPGAAAVVGPPSIAEIPSKPEVTQITAGINYYVNPNVRFMLNYSIGEGEVDSFAAPSTKTTTEVEAVALRTQLSF
jgi:phosphate-selective porin OprO/OprP